MGLRHRLSLLVATAAIALFATSVAQAADPGAIFSCQATGQIARIDPIVSPGVFPSAHPHQFYGAKPIETRESTADLRTKPTSCVEKGNHTGYWMPPVYENGVRRHPGTTADGGGKHLLVYYRCKHNATICHNMRSFPLNFAQVAGNSNASSPSQNPILADRELSGWRCGVSGGLFSPTPPARCPDGVLTAGVTYGNCLLPNGHTSMDVNAHCTDRGGRPIVRIQQYFRWWVGEGTVGHITIGGDHPAYQLHADVFFGWTQSAFDNFLNRCIRQNRDCGKNPDV